MLSNRALIENDDVYPSGLKGPLSAVVELLVGDVVGHFRQTALVVPSDDETLVEYRGVHLGPAGMEADLHRCGRCSCFPTITQSLSCMDTYSMYTRVQRYFKYIHVYHTLLVKFPTDEGFFVLPNVFGIHECLTTRHLRSTERVLWDQWITPSIWRADLVCGSAQRRSASGTRPPAGESYFVLAFPPAM